MKKLLTILVLIMLIISFFQITNMYALYKEQLEGEYSTLLGAWEIKVNTTDITSSGQIESFVITDDQLGYVSSEYIQAGKIAPNGQSYFDIVIDPANTDVSIVYQIDIETDITGTRIIETEGTEETETTVTTETIELENAIELISVENYLAQEDENGELTNQTTNTTVYKDGNSYTSVIPVDKITQGYKNYIRIYFKWVNVEANNEKDKILGENEQSTISIPLQINLKQYTGEVIGNGS